MAVKEVCYSMRRVLRGDIWQQDTLLFCGDSVSRAGKEYLILGQKGHPVSAMLAYCESLLRAGGPKFAAGSQQ